MSVRSGGHATLRAGFDAFAEDWIGLADTPVSRLLHDDAWTPDARRDYCGRCGQSVGAGERTPDGCRDCRGRRPAVDGVVRLGRYRGALARLVRRAKYERDGVAAETMGAALGAAVHAAAVVDPDACVVVPVPMPWPRRAARGIDHARAIGDAVAVAIGGSARSVLRRSSSVPTQVRASSADARRERRAHFAWRHAVGRRRAVPRTVLLVDDVLTTGATLAAAARSLRAAGVERVVAAVAAVADPPGRGAALEPSRKCPD